MSVNETSTDRQRSDASQPALVATRLTKRYGDVVALDGVSLDIRSGEIMTLLGPSGSGKTTLLKAIAGFEDVDAGKLSLFGRDITDMDPARRDIGMLFQSYALFPHMTVAENVGFPLRMRKVPKTQIDAEVRKNLELVELGSHGDRLPSQLSGGQQQRVALARAIIFNPRLLLLDEPFSALDRKLRETMQLELRRLQKRLGLTTVFVTHDQEEALVLSDRIAVMNGGRIEQLAQPHDLYENPSSYFVASFIGQSNLLTGRVIETSGDIAHVQIDSGEKVVVRVANGSMPVGDVKLSLRPERIRAADPSATEDNLFPATVVEQIYLGESSKYRVRLQSGFELVMRLHPHACGSLRPGAATHVAWSSLDMRVVP